MKEIAIYGAGGFGRETALLVSEINRARDQWNLLGFFDDGVKAGTMIDNLPILGGLNELNNWNESIDVVIAIADPNTRMNLVGSIASKKVDFPSIVHPNALLGSPFNRLGKGSIITAGVILTTGITIGDFVIVNLAGTIGHDVVLGSFTSLMPQCSISGNVKLGARCFVGSGVRILQGISLGDDSIVGAGAVVTKSFSEKSRLIGIPAKPME